jgi:pSer/pThr/pTyr-binding forkhead associated (FHA) protein
MSAVLLVTKDKKQVAKIPVTGSQFVIGRSPECNLPLDETLASRQHTEIIFERGSYWVQDRGSRNGTVVNGEKITARRELKDGDEIGIGSTRLKFLWDKSAAEAEESDEDATRVASPDVAKKLPGLEVVKKTGTSNLEVKVRVVDGPLQGGVFQNWEGPLTIGRGLQNNVVLLDDAVSTSQAQIVQEGEQYFIVDLNSSNGTFLDGVKVKKSQLANGQKIKIGISTLAFELVDLRIQRKNRKIALISFAAIVVIAILVKLLQPKDVAGQYIALAQNYAGQGDYSKAMDQYSLALKIDPNRVEAKRGMMQTKAAIEARDILNTAENEAAAENYDKANDLVYRVLRDFPQSGRAQELEAVIKSIENAKIAFAARNWSDAKVLLEKAQDAYPQSKLIHQRLDQAQMELTAQSNLAQAQDALQHQQFDMAQPMLQSIPPNSVYYTEAKQALDQISKNQQITVFLNKAQGLYRDGHLTEALTQIASGLAQSPDSSPLLDLQTRVRQMAALYNPLVAAEAMSQPTDTDALLQNRKACDDVIQLEADPLNSLRKRAQAAEAKIAGKLTDAAQISAASATQLLQAGNQKDALRLFDLAVKANPDDQNVTDQRNKLRQQIVTACRSLYQKGLVHDELGQADLARQAYQQVIDMGIPGEDYYERAVKKLKSASQ